MHQQHSIKVLTKSFSRTRWCQSTVKVFEIVVSRLRLLHLGSSLEQVRNGSAFVHAVGAVHNIFEAVIAHRQAKAATLVEEDDELAEADIDNPSLYVENFRNKCVGPIDTAFGDMVSHSPRSIHRWMSRERSVRL